MSTISNSTINGSVFQLNILLLTVNDATIDRCKFQGLVDQVTITGSLTKCLFEKISNNLIITGPLDDMTILVDLTPASASYVLDRDVPSKLISIPTLKIDKVTIPRLAELPHKECFINIINPGNKTTFIVLLSTDDTNPSGVILMWNGLATNIPKGYAICDGGTYNGVTTPDLRGRFIRMISQGENVGEKTNSELVDNGSGTRTGYIQIHDYNLPSHLHQFDISADIDVSGLSTDEQGSEYTESYSYVSEYSGTQVNEGEGDPADAGDAVSVDTEQLTFDWTHTHSIQGTASLTNVVVTLNALAENYENRKINIEPNAYALVFIMKL